MAPTHPLEIQEIADLVASYLRSRDVTACIRVSKGWRDMFLPHRWRIVRAGLDNESDYGPFPVGPKKEAICNHRHLIQDLTLLGKIRGYTNFYPNLRRLVINNNRNTYEGGRLFMDLTKKAPMLVDLKLSLVKTPSRFWDRLSKHPHLRNLCLMCIPFKADGWPGFWKTCMNLEALEIFTNMEAGRRPLNMVFDRLRHLKLAIINLPQDAYLLDLVVQSPRLESLDLDIDSRKGIGEQPLIDWPHLKKLHVSGSIKDTHLALFFKRVGKGPGNIGVEPYLSRLDTQAKVFGSHFHSLVDVDLFRVMYTIVSTIPDIMCFCPRLERLRCTTVLARSVAERGPWVCQQLRELRIRFAFDVSGSEQGLKQLMFERLSTLVRLERLTLDYDCDFSASYDGLDFRLDCGLGELASLQQLSYLRLRARGNRVPKPNLGMEEVEWILKKWKKLKMIKGDLSRTSEFQYQLKSAFGSRGITVKD